MYRAAVHFCQAGGSRTDRLAAHVKAPWFSGAVAAVSFTARSSSAAPVGREAMLAPHLPVHRERCRRTTLPAVHVHQRVKHPDLRHAAAPVVRGHECCRPLHLIRCRGGLQARMRAVPKAGACATSSGLARQSKRCRTKAIARPQSLRLCGRGGTEACGAARWGGGSGGMLVHLRSQAHLEMVADVPQGYIARSRCCIAPCWFGAMLGK